MRWFLAALLAAAPLAPVAALAQGTGWTAAPVPNRTFSLGSPSSRAGSPDGAERASPFSGLPNVVESRGDDPAPTVDTSLAAGSPVPSLSR